MNLRSRWSRHAIAAGLVGAALALRFLLAPWLGERSPYDTFFAAVAASALWLGRGPGILAAALGWIAGDLCFLEHAALRFHLHLSPASSESVNALVKLATYLGTCTVTIALSEALRAAGRRATASHAEAVAERRELERAAQEKTRAEAALGESQARFHTLARASFEGIVISEDGRIIEANERFERMFGYSPGEVVGMPVRAFLDRPSAEQVLPAMEEGLDLGGEYRAVRKDGSTFMIESIGRTIEIGGRKIRIGALRDITPRKLAEEALRQSEARFRSLFESAPVGIAVLSGEGRFLQVNPALCRFLGYSQEDLLGMTALDASVPEDRAGTAERIRRVMEGEVGLERVEKRFLHKRGEVLWGDLSCCRVAEAGGRPSCMLAQVVDITERRRAGEELRLARECLGLAQRAARAGSWDWNIEAEKMTWSEELFDLFGLDPTVDQATFETWLRVLHPEDRDPAMARIRRSLEERTLLENDYRIVLPGGGIRWISAIGRTQYGEDERALRMSGICIDTTERREAEIALRRSREELRDLTARLHRSREEEQARIAREIHDELGQLLTRLKIDLRTIEQRIGALEGGPAVNPVLDLAVGASELVDRTMTSVRTIASGIRSPVLDKLGLVPAIQEEARRFQESTGIPCRAILPDGEPAVGGEAATALFRIFQEAITNVARHAGASRVEVSLGVDDGRMVLQVGDDGRGFDPGDLKDASALGLLGMRERAVRLGGEVIVGRRDGAGTLVTASIPR